MKVPCPRPQIPVPAGTPPILQIECDDFAMQSMSNLAAIPQRRLGKIGHLLSCQRDGTFCEGYDCRITETIMHDASHCDYDHTFEEP
jgi:hypothetical protein